MNKTSLLELAKKVKSTIIMYKEIVFSSDNPVCMACLDELRRQQAIDQHVYDQRLMEDTMRELAWEGLQRNIVMDGDTMIDKGTGEVWILRLILHTGKTSFKTIFTVFIDHKITCRRVEEIHILNGIDTLGTWTICDFS